MAKNRFRNLPACELFIVIEHVARIGICRDPILISGKSEIHAHIHFHNIQMKNKL